MIAKAFSVLCEDVRQEVNGKISLIGAFLGGISLEDVKPPHTFPKLSLVTWVYQPLETLQKFDVIVSGVPFGAETYKATIDPTEDAGDDNADGMFVAVSVAQWTPARLLAPGFIEVKIVQGDSVYEAARFPVAFRHDQDAASQS